MNERTWRIADDSGNSEEIRLAAEAQPRIYLEEWLQDGGWDTSQGTIWVSGRITPLDDEGELLDAETLYVTVTIEQAEPDCADGTLEHSWLSGDDLWEAAGGLRENPGVGGHGGGVIITDVCGSCGVRRTTDTWAQNPATGEQGLRSVRWEMPDEMQVGA